VPSDLLDSYKVCQLFAASLLLSPGTPVFSTNNTDVHDINEILVKVALNNNTNTSAFGGHLD
jgi:hypothetical protein